MSNLKKRVSDVSFKGKSKKKKLNPEDIKNEDEMSCTNSISHKTKFLDIQTVREGMLLLGCVTNVRKAFFEMSLPGCLSGVVEACSISNAFTNAVATFFESGGFEEPAIESVIEVGMTFPCKVIKVDLSIAKKPHIALSIKPEDINENLKPSSLYPKMVLLGSVSSIEDHGYVVDIGIEGIHGFLSEHISKSKDKILKVGQVIPMLVQKIIFSDKKTANIQLSKLDFSQNYPEILAPNIKLHSILPGARISADVIEVTKHFVIMKYLAFDACACLFPQGFRNKSIRVGSAVQGTVLYVNPITHMIFLTLSSVPTPDSFLRFFGLRKFEIILNPKFQFCYKNQAYYKVTKGTYGFINVRNLPGTGGSKAKESPLAEKDIQKACVLHFHYMDNLVEMNARASVTSKEIIFPEEVQAGDIYSAVVQKHKEDGMFVRICLGLYGFVRRLHMSDVFITKAETLYPVGSEVKCRVLHSDGNGKLSLTCKESLLNLQQRYILSSYNNVQKGQFYKGVVVNITDAYMIVLFFNNIKGIVPHSHIPKAAVFFMGQTVLCEVLECNPRKERLQLSLKTESWCPIENTEFNMSGASVKSKDVMPGLSKKLHYAKVESSSSDSEVESNAVLSKDNKTDSTTKELLLVKNSSKLTKAVIKKVKGNQLNILINRTKGRVHITELGCSSEGLYPIKEFTAKQKVYVYITGEFMKRRRNYLDISHRNLISFKECTLKLPSTPFIRDFKPGDSVIGFVKEAHDICVTLWLSPNKTGVLDYLHFSENPKIVRKLKRHLKVGLSLNVSILEKQQISEKEKATHSIVLTKIDCFKPQVGKSVLGLVQIACLERGLILKLPFGYHGAVSITDLTDVYATVHSLFEKYRNLKFLLCHVLEVNHETKYCSLSLRKSRLFEKKAISNSFCPEITPDSIRPGDHVKGYVKFVSNSSISVEIGREFEGKVLLHYCASTNCAACKFSKRILEKYPVGSVVDVIFESTDVQEKFIFTLSELKVKENTSSDRLCIKEDIPWDEIQ